MPTDPATLVRRIADYLLECDLAVDSAPDRAPRRRADLPPATPELVAAWWADRRRFSVACADSLWRASRVAPVDRDAPVDRVAPLLRVLEASYLVRDAGDAGLSPVLVKGSIRDVARDVRRMLAQGESDEADDDASAPARTR